jgi:hypothetical protein
MMKGWYGAFIYKDDKYGKCKVSTLFFKPCANPIFFLEVHCFEAGKPGKEEPVEEEADNTYNPLVAYMTQGINCASDSEESLSKPSARTSKAVDSTLADDDYKPAAVKKSSDGQSKAVDSTSSDDDRKPAAKKPSNRKPNATVTILCLMTIANLYSQKILSKKSSGPTSTYQGTMSQGAVCGPPGLREDAVESN